jgi:hypothetical protein
MAAAKWFAFIWEKGRCFDFQNIFAENLSKKI